MDKRTPSVEWTIAQSDADWARLLGHTSLDTVLIYTEPNLADLAERMERVEVADIPIKE